MRKVTRKLNYGELFVDSYSFFKDESEIGFRVFYQSNVNPTKAAIFFINGRWQNSLLWAKDNPQRDLRIYFAMRGYIVCSMDYRTSFLNRNEVSICKDWDTGIFLSDIEYCINLFSEEKQIDQLFIAGYSMGAALGYMLPYHKFDFKVNGFISLDGGNKHHKRLHEKNINEEIHKFELFHNGIILNPSHDKRFRRHAIQKLSSKFSNSFFEKIFDDDLIRYLLIENSNWPARQVAEMNSIADYDSHPVLMYDQNTRAMTLPIYCVAAVDKLEEIEIHRGVVSARYTSSKEINILALEKWSHTEVVASEKSINEVWGPLEKWIEMHS